MQARKLFQKKTGGYLMSKRRDFIKEICSTAMVIGAAGFPMEAFSKNDVVKISVLHTNDVHSHIEPFLKTIQSMPDWVVLPSG